MQLTKSQPHPVPGPREQLSTRITFFVSGAGMATWAPLVPFMKARTGIDDGPLGMLLLCLGVGSMVSMPVASMLAARFGCRLTIIVSIALVCFALPILTTVDSGPLLALALLTFGAGVGSLDVAMNIQAIIVERASGRAMMSGFHGLFSLGGIIGAMGIMMLLAAGVSLLAATLCIVAAMAISLVMVASDLLPYGGSGTRSAIAVPRGVVLFIGILCFISFLTEGAMLDWSAVFLTSVRGIDAAHAGGGYAAFSLAMTIGRLLGDRVVQRFGGTNVIALGSLCAATGLTLTVYAPTLELTLVGFALVGAGCSNIVPVLFTGVGRQTVIQENVAVPVITTLGYAGILAGPAAIGFISHMTSLSTAFLILTILLLCVAAGGRRLGID